MSNIGDQQLAMGQITFDSSYATGGEVFDPSALMGIHAVNNAFFENKNGYRFEYDHVNKKLKAYWLKKVPAVVYDEHVVFNTSYQTTLKYPAAFIVNVAKTGENQGMRSTGIASATLAVNQCCLASQMAYDTLTTLTFGTGTTFVANGGFNGSNSWVMGNGWTYTAPGTIDKSAAGVGTLSQTFTTIIGHTYTLVFTVSGLTSGSVTPKVGGTTGTAVSANGTYTQQIVAGATSGGVVFTPTATTDRYSIAATVSVADSDVFVTYVTQAWQDVWNNVVQDESITLATGANNLTSGNSIAAIMYLDQITATAGALSILSSADTATAGTVPVAFGVTTGQLKANAAQNAKAAKITYLKMPSSGFILDRAVYEMTGAAGGAGPYTSTFSRPLILWGYTGCMPVTGSATLGLLSYADTSATGQAVIDYFTVGTKGAGTVADTYDDVQGIGAGLYGR